MTRNGGRRALDTGPSTNSAVPADNRVQYARIVLDLGILEDDGFLHPRTRADVGSRSNRDVGAQLSGGVDVCRGVDEDG